MKINLSWFLVLNLIIILMFYLLNRNQILLVGFSTIWQYFVFNFMYLVYFVVENIADKNTK